MMHIRLLLVLVLTCSWSCAVLAQQVSPLVTRSEPELLAVLNSAASRKEKADACVELAVIGSRAAVPTLVRLLPDVEMSHMARYALQTMPDPAVDEALREALETAQGRPLLGVISSLGARRDVRAVRPLAPFLEAADDELVQAAARALGAIGGSPAAGHLLRALPMVSPRNALAVQEGLLRCAEALVEADDRVAALKVYEALAGLTGADHQVQAAALRGRILASRRDEGLQLLRQALMEEDYGLAAAAVRSAQEMAGSEVTAALTANLSALPTDRQILVLASLGERGDVSALPAMEQVIEEGETQVRVAAVEALAGMREPDVIRVLVVLVQHAEAAVAEAAKESLAALAFPGVDAAVVKMMNSTDTSTRLIGIELAGRRRMSEVMAQLLQAAEDPDPRIRVAALRRVGELGTETELDPLLGLLTRAGAGGDRDALEQALTAIASRASRPELVVDPVIAAMASAQPAVRVVLVRVLGVVGGDEALARVRAAVDDGDPEVRTAALRTLSTWKSVAVAPELLALAQERKAPAERALCIRGYLSWVRNTDLEIPQRLAMCAQIAPLIESTEEKRQLLGAAGSVPSVEAFRFATAQLDDEAIREEAAAAVASIAEPLLKVSLEPAQLEQVRAALQQAKDASPGEALVKRLDGLLKEGQERR